MNKVNNMFYAYNALTILVELDVKVDTYFFCREPQTLNPDLKPTDRDQSDGRQVARTWIH